MAASDHHSSPLPLFFFYVIYLNGRHTEGDLSSAASLPKGPRGAGWARLTSEAERSLLGLLWVQGPPSAWAPSLHVNGSGTRTLSAELGLLSQRLPLHFTWSLWPQGHVPRAPSVLPSSPAESGQARGRREVLLVGSVRGAPPPAPQQCRGWYSPCQGQLLTFRKA